MGHVEQVWDRLEFRTPWAKARRARADPRRTGPLPRLAPRPDPRRWWGSRSRSARSWSCRTASGSLGGYADRLELDADGRVVVVDLKTGEASHRRQVLPTSSSGSTSSRSTTAPLDELVDQEARAGGAELVQLGLPGTTSTPPSRQQPGQADDGAAPIALQLG